MSIRDELLALKNQDDLIVPERAVEWARAHPGSALHKALPWDDKKAAHEYRIWKIRQLISIHVVYETGQRQLVSLSIDRGRTGGGYRVVDDVLPIKSLRDVMLEDALKELLRIQAKYETVKELASVWAAVDKVARKRRRTGGGGEARPAKQA